MASAVNNNPASSLNMAQMMKSVQSAYQKNKTQSAQISAQKTPMESSAFEVDISAAGKNAQTAAAPNVSTLGFSSAPTSAEGTENQAQGETKGITADQARALQDQVNQSYNLMIQTMTDNNLRIQNMFNEGIYDLRGVDGSLFSLGNFVLPEVGTTPEEAQAAISEGGNYSVEAVSDRIFNLASAIAGSDPKMLEEMRSAVEKGFEQAGIAFKDATGRDDMPQITKDTHAEIMSRFDKRAEELNGTAKL
ncbi:MAG TPA: hypothetical protein DEP57_07565 [Selenomonas sp.]|nr:hypothetical protein [Selenomonas sp.]